MSFDSIIGQRKAKKILTRALQQKRVPHAYLFYGGPGVGKEALALELAKALLCQTNGTEPCDQCSHCSRVAKLTHPDLVYLFPAPQTIKPEEHQLVLQSLIKDPYYRLRLWANPSISIERIRELRRTSAYKSFEGRGRVIIIAEADTMTIEASNALLKILEEPPEKMNLILTTSNVTQILPTITSRCQMIRFEPLSYQDIETALIKRKKLEPEPARLIARLASGNFRRALELLQEDLPAKRQMVINVLR
ncbi:MAG: DNA polymerase III subunit delta', partial [candidate division KSB1 bacterium]|nr:DNA polymerase III subunit delta' [candidate division KSB1 bacterium]